MTARVLATVLFLGVLAAAGCGGPSAKVTGRVTCQGKPVAGLILFSPKTAEGGKSVTATLGDDGGYEVLLTGVGTYTVVVTPADVKAHPKRGEFDYPCNRTPLEREITAGDNDVTIELGKRTK
jgi:hypothetical protein